MGSTSLNRALVSELARCDGRWQLWNWHDSHSFGPWNRSMPEGVECWLYHRCRSGPSVDRSSGRTMPPQHVKETGQCQAADERRTGLRSIIEDRGRTALRSVWIREVDRRTTGSSHTSLSRPGDERRKLQTQTEQDH